MGYAEEIPPQDIGTYHIESLPLLTVSTGNKNVFSTPIAYFDGSLFSVNVEEGKVKNNGLNLWTVIRKASRARNGRWKWIDSYVLEHETIFNIWHTQPSIGIDKKGYIHVAYNMHNMPWQYAVSRKPGDISEFDFLGQPITYEDKRVVKIENRVPFPTLGSGAIPGNQISYPAFFTDRQGELYVTYRYATKPTRPWKDRGFAGGLAKYNINTKTWSSIGGKLAVTMKDARLPHGKASGVTTPLIYEPRWVVYLPKIAFDGRNRLHVVWTWREESAGRFVTSPSYAMSQDGGNTFVKSNKDPYTLPISLNQSERYIPSQSLHEYEANSFLTVNDKGDPFMIVTPANKRERWLISYNPSKAQWNDPEKCPSSASILYVDSNDIQLAVAQGPTIFRRNVKRSVRWNKIFSHQGYGIPKLLVVPNTQELYIHTQSFNSKRVKIFRLEKNDRHGKKSTDERAKGH